MNFDSCWQIIWREAVYKRMLSVSRECSLSSIVHDRIHIQEDQRTQILTPIVIGFASSPLLHLSLIFVAYWPLSNETHPQVLLHSSTNMIVQSISYVEYFVGSIQLEFHLRRAHSKDLACWQIQGEALLLTFPRSVADSARLLSLSFVCCQSYRRQRLEHRCLLKD